MMRARRSSKAGILAAALACALPLSSAPAPKLSGSIAGYVRSAAGVPQMGALVALFNKSDRLIQQAITNERGIFGFDLLTPDTYSIRVTLTSFVPAMKQRIAVQPGMQSLLYINMASILSSVELVYALPGQGALMSDDWKWTLKASSATRPILRYLPDISASDPNRRQAPSGNTIFSDTRGVLNLSAGDGGTINTLGDSDLGTAFALATSLFGHNQLKLSGNLGYTGRVGLPATAFRTTFTRDDMSPQIAVTVRQIYLPTRTGISAGPGDSIPAIRTMSVATTDTLRLGDDLRLDYGSSLDTLAFVQRLNYLSPFARLTYDMDELGSVQLAYSSGMPPTELLQMTNNAGAETGVSDPQFSRDFAMLALMPGISMRDSQVRVQRTQNFEIGYEKDVHNTKFSALMFRELVNNGSFTMWGDGNLLSPGDVM